MNQLLEPDVDTDNDDFSSGEREITLGIPTILGILLALALVCGAFFGFGYEVGHKASETGSTSPAPSVQNSSTRNLSGQNLSGQSLSGQEPAPPASAPAPSVPKPADGGFLDKAPAQPAPAETPRSASAPAAHSGAAPVDTVVVHDKVAVSPPKPSAAIPQATPAVHPQVNTVAPTSTPSGGFIVQVAAVTGQDIADIEVTALKKYGYNVSVRHEPEDKLLHIQIGPFANRKDAEAMRQDVLSHGFNAIVK